MQTTANLWEVLCRDLESQRQAATADQYEAIAQRFLQTARHVLRANSPKLCDAIEIAGDVCQAAGRREEALSDFREALLKACEIGRTDSAARLSAKLALLHDELGDGTAARSHFQRSLGFYDEIQDHSQHAMLLNQLGGLCKRMRDFPAAEKSYLQAMEVATKLHGPDHPEVAAAANNLGVAYTESREFVKAESVHMQALAIREKSFGALHPEVAQSMANLAVVYHATGKLKKAASYYDGALKTYRRFRDGDDAEMAAVRENYDALLRKMQKLSSS